MFKGATPRTKLVHSIPTSHTFVDLSFQMTAITVQSLPGEAFKQTLRKRHLEQLRGLSVPDAKSRVSDAPWPTSHSKASSPYEQLVQWSKKAHVQIQKAVAKRQYTLLYSAKTK